MTQDVTTLIHEDGGIGIVEWHRPPTNYLDVPLLDGIIAGIDELADSGCRAIVLRAEGKHFCAGRDFSAVRKEGDSPGEVYDRAGRLYAAPVPLVAEVQGGAIGAGLGLAAIADFRVAGPRAYFWANFVKIGTHPGFGLTHTLPDIIGPQRARWMLAVNERIGVHKAAEWHLVDRVASESGLAEASMKLARELADLPARALAELRSTLRGAKAVEAFYAVTAHELAAQERLRLVSDPEP